MTDRSADETKQRLKVSRTSIWDNDTKPIEDVERGYYECPAGEPTFWYREFESLQALLEFVDEHGDLVLQQVSNYDHHPPVEYEVEIYDDYRE